MSDTQTCNTVFILGAGFSFDAGIPLMGGFVDTMWDLAIRGSWKSVPLGAEDRDLFGEANKIRAELNEYHGRAAFDDRNIEDILSILSFNSYANKRRSPDPMATIVKAIGRTIEITCSVEHPGLPPNLRYTANQTGPNLYRAFWAHLFAAKRGGVSFPSIITFNYDLVLERSLFQVLIGTHLAFNGDVPPPSRHVRIRHHFPTIKEPIYAIESARYGNSQAKPGTILKAVKEDEAYDTLDIEILKLHGSLNFPAPRQKPALSDGVFNVCEALPSPLILPPIFNKQSTESQRSIWSAALSRLRSVKNIVIVGYSLPRTDIYMQYFLKSALGPNMDLNRIFVFDPAIYAGAGQTNEMKQRYEECFSPQLRSRIHFRPDEVGASAGRERLGTAAHFVHALGETPNKLLF
ncbi:hypothetical protein [Variovorax sp. LT1R16]|uniref:hypothetical protein n=1 Tax=Variovorax sp. LT1R16 TaxID=3443728 RepID=UPI003F469B6F